MTALINITFDTVDQQGHIETEMIDLAPKQETYHEFDGYAFVYLDNLYNAMSFTRSNGTVFARIYERLTKRSRRRPSHYGDHLDAEAFYRWGVKDTLEALRIELS